MADTHGFEVVLEAAEAVLRKFLRGAWKSAECPDPPGDEGRIPEFYEIPAGTLIGGFEVARGQVQIPQDELDASMAPEVNGTEIKLGLHLQVEIKDPPVPSAVLWEMRADVRARAPIGTLPDSLNVAILLDGLPRANVTAALTSGDPLALKLETLLAEYVHKAYENGSPGAPHDPDFPTIPHVIEETDEVWPVPGGSVTVDAYGELYDDLADPAHRIHVTLTADHSTVIISIPIYLRIYNIRRTGTATLLDLRDPMGSESRINISAPFSELPGSYSVQMNAATVTVDPLTPAPGVEGANYTHNTSLPLVGGLIVTMMQNHIKNRGQEMTQSFDAEGFTIDVPTVAEIETVIGDLFHADLEARQFIEIWLPKSTGGELTVENVTVKALTDALVIALNGGAGADVNAMTNFIPAGREFAIALAGSRVQTIIDESRVENSFADADLPKRFREDDKDVDLTQLDVFLVNGAIRMTGEVTVINAILGSIDVDADFRHDIGLHWEPNGVLNINGVQNMRHHDIGEPDIDPEESVAFWVITIILAVISFGTFGLIGALIVVIVGLIVRGIASNIGSRMLVDTVSGAIEGITAWPPELSRIGFVQAVFHDPISIDTSGLVMSGMMEVISTCEATAVVGAASGGPYSAPAATALMLSAANTHPDAVYQWSSGDGSAPVNTQTTLHTYVASGLYVARHALTINQTGGATSQHFALVDVQNVPPSVDAGPDITVNEGELVTLIGHFQDVEYPDTHESSWNFGDNQAPKSGTLVETNTPPMAMGTTTVQHAWCDNGVYTVTLRVRDQNGGMAADTRTVTVLNVPPVVDTEPSMYAYPCTVITLTGTFADPGWCDSHVGTWDFGDCTPLQTAVIRETHEPRAGHGQAIASHIYEQCGTYHAICTVIDDDGGVGENSTVIRVIHVKNAGFEEGFRKRQAGEVANHWEPYFAAPETFPPATGTPVQPAETGVFSCAQCLIRGGQWSQRIQLTAPLRAGIYQQVGANSTWDYQVSAWYTLAELSSGAARLGIDPAGGTDPTAPGIVWLAGQERRQWAQLSERVSATDSAITIFLEAVAGDRLPLDACFDDVVLVPIQPFCPEAKPAVEDREERCVDFTDQKPDTQLSVVYAKNGFTFRALDNQPLAIVGWAVPTGQSKLQLRRMGVLIDLPWPAEWARVRVAHYDKPVEVTALDRTGNMLGHSVSPPAQDALHPVEIAAAGIVQLRLIGGGEALLFEICARRDRREAVEQARRQAARIEVPSGHLPRTRRRETRDSQ